MRITAYLLLAVSLHLSATTVSQTVTFQGTNVPIKKVFAELTRQTDISVMYNPDVLEGARPITINVQNMPFADFLQRIFTGQPFQFALEGKTVFVGRKIMSPVDTGLSNAPPADIHGRVTDSAGNALVGASVTVKGTRLIVATDDNGEFSFAGVPENTVLLVSFVGYEEQQVHVMGRTDIKIILKINAAQLKDVEVTLNTGYQKVNREQFVGSTATLDSAAYSRRAGMNILNRLDGTVAGVFLDKNASIAPLQIRGISTLQNNSAAYKPLIILDNFPYQGDLNSINPNDVLDMTILKDAAAASVWGTRAGNGVIVINTKRGGFNQPLRVNISSNVSIQQKPDVFFYPQISASDEIDVEKFLFEKGFYNSNLTNKFNRPVVSPVVEILNKVNTGEITQAEADDQVNAFRTLDIRQDLSKYMYRPSIAQQHYVNLQGGNEVINFSLSAGYNNAQSSIQHTGGNDLYTLKSIISARPTKRLELEAEINISSSSDRSASLYSQAIGFPVSIYPYARLADPSGLSMVLPAGVRQSFTDTAGNGKLLNWQYRPLDEISNTHLVTKGQLTQVNLSAGYKVFSWLKGEIKMQHFQQTGTVRNFYNSQSYYTRNLLNRYSQVIDGTVVNNIPVGGILDLSSSEATSNSVRGQLSVNKLWRNKHALSAMVAGELSDAGSSLNSNRFYGYDDELLTYATALDYNTRFPTYANLMGTAKIPQGTSINEGAANRFVSVLANASYNYSAKYFLYASARRDGANVFGVNTNNRWKPLWSAGAGWNISSERFYNIHWLNYLKLRMSYGYTGNVDNTRSGLPTIEYSDLSYLTNLQTAVVGSAPNPDLKWEQVQLFNTGVDFSLIKGRLAGTFDVYRKKSTDLIAPTPIDPTTGVSDFIVNIASLKGTGYELQLNSKNTRGLIKWQTSFGLTYNKTTVTNYANGGFKASQFINYGINPKEGQIAWGISSYRSAGLDPATGDPQGYLNKQVSKDYLAISNDSLGNQVFNGSSLPLYSGYLFNSISWNNFSLSANITYRLDYFFRKATINYISLFFNWSGHGDFNKRWQKPGDETITTVPSMPYPFDANRDAFYANSDVNVKRADHIRLQDIKLSYDWKFAKNNAHGLSTIQFFVYANNLNVILWRQDKSVDDPENYNNIIPPSRILTVGVNANF